MRVPGLSSTYPLTFSPFYANLSGKVKNLHMSKIVFFDTETTGLDKTDRLCQVAFLDDGEMHSSYFKPPVPISIGAMATHHITNGMVDDLDAFDGSELKDRMQQLISQNDTVFVAHNAKFDIEMLKREGLIIPRSICTLKVARYIDKDATIESFSLQYLRYYLRINVVASPHDAEGDVTVLKMIFEKLIEILIADDELSDVSTKEDAILEMISITQKPSLIRTFRFGKHNGKTLAEVALSDTDYLNWLLGEKRKEEDPDGDWIYSLEHYLNK